MGRPRKTSDAVASPRCAATAPKAAPATPKSSASTRAVSASSKAPATRSKSGQQGSAEKPLYAGASSGEQFGSEGRRGARSKSSAAAGETKAPAVTSGDLPKSFAKPSQAPAKTQAKASRLPAPLPANKIAEIEQETRGQRSNPAWHHWRENRITASNAAQIANCKFVNGRSSEVPQSYLKKVVGPGSTVQTPAMSWGLRNEQKAVAAYEDLKSRKTNKPVKVNDCGLYIDKEKPWLGASPDGVVTDANTGKHLGIVEVKCPYKHRDRTVTEACKDQTFCLEKEGDTYALKKSHPYYTQVQTQLKVTGLQKADFVVHTNKETAIAPVDFDPDFWEKTAPKLEKFYRDAVVPHLEEREKAAVLAKEE